MNTQQTTDTSTSSSRRLIAEEAAYWLVSLRSDSFSPDGPYRDAATRNAAFFEWIRRSAAHLMLFLEMVEVDRRFRQLDDATVAEIRELIRERQQPNDQGS